MVNTRSWYFASGESFWGGVDFIHKTPLETKEAMAIEDDHIILEELGSPCARLMSVEEVLSLQQDMQQHLFLLQQMPNTLSSIVWPPPNPMSDPCSMLV
jgi:hypothetical protein